MATSPASSRPIPTTAMARPAPESSGPFPNTTRSSVNATGAKPTTAAENRAWAVAARRSPARSAASAARAASASNKAAADEPLRLLSRNAAPASRPLIGSAAATRSPIASASAPASARRTAWRRSIREPGRRLLGLRPGGKHRFAPPLQRRAGSLPLLPGLDQSLSVRGGRGPPRRRPRAAGSPDGRRWLPRRRGAAVVTRPP